MPAEVVQACWEGVEAFWSVGVLVSTLADLSQQRDLQG